MKKGKQIKVQQLKIIIISWMIMGLLITIHDHLLLLTENSAGVSENYSFLVSMARNVGAGLVGGLGLAVPLINAQALGMEQRAVEAQARQMLAQYEQTVLLAFKEVEDALVAVSTANEQRKAQEQQVDALRSALHIADLRYKGGITSYVDVLLAKRNLFDAEFALAATHRLHLISVVQLYKALGGGWFAG